MMNEALESVIRYARNKLMEEIAELNDKTEGIACKGLFPVYEQNYSYTVSGRCKASPENRHTQRVYDRL